MSLKSTSKYLSLILRHEPELIGITLDEHGWAEVDALIAGVSHTHPLTMETLEQIVREDAKQRYSFNGDKTLIRANQGHSVPVDVELEEVTPPEVLYHGTGRQSTASIDAQGLLPMSRLYVHLSADYATAKTVGQRHGKPVVYRVHSGKMYADGFRFYRSVNGVWLTEAVPARYLEKMP
ncbi:MAG: RNA 2'-phosphotransferase [Clostridiales bacterium]|nr:RNA 2'-phosphotransferase [Clostridiales bacterium]